MGLIVGVRVTPKARSNACEGWVGTEVAVRVTAAPDKGKANDAVCETVAEALGVPKSSVRVVRGHASRHKLVEIDGPDEAALERAFGPNPTPLL
ncbi:MAG: DUF167 domain-containing protein [Anaerosomatales bacterium]|nr:DUF167 domain-containing protein [Anaerosomatales bacterium]